MLTEHRAGDRRKAARLGLPFDRWEDLDPAAGAAREGVRCLHFAEGTRASTLPDPRLRRSPLEGGDARDLEARGARRGPPQSSSIVTRPSAMTATASPVRTFAKRL